MQCLHRPNMLEDKTKKMYFQRFKDVDCSTKDNVQLLLCFLTWPRDGWCIGLDRLGSQGRRQRNQAKYLQINCICFDIFYRICIFISNNTCDLCVLELQGKFRSCLNIRDGQSRPNIFKLPVCYVFIFENQLYFYQPLNLIYCHIGFSRMSTNIAVNAGWID